MPAEYLWELCDLSSVKCVFVGRRIYFFARGATLFHMGGENQNAK